jgi:RNA polymerase sigma-70 factor (ECF subfamily)
LGDKSEAEDVLQDVYLTVWRKAASFDEGVASPITWLVAIAQLEISDDQARLRDCLQELEQRQSAAIRAAFLDGFTYEQLAEKASVPLGTMKSWIRRGLLKLRACLER